MSHKKHALISQSTLICLFCVIALALGFSGYRFYRNEEAAIRKQKHSELEAIVSLKIGQIIVSTFPGSGDLEAEAKLIAIQAAEEGSRLWEKFRGSLINLDLHRQSLFSSLF
ncbi:MAG: hypothetical protein Q8N95_06370 [Desulfobacterales bacterium]|nr:hypothetical protein [Desulfobacterales bacterium]